MSPAPGLKSMAFRWCSKVDWNKTTVCDDLVSYGFCTGEIYGIEEDYIPAAKRIRTGDGGPLSIVMPVVP